MAYRVIRPATHEEWLDERKKGIGSSEAGTVMGVNHFDTPYKLWRRKTGVDGPIPSSEAMELGHHIWSLPELSDLSSGLKRVAALFFGRECTILRLRLVKDFAAYGHSLAYRMLRKSPRPVG